MQRFPVLAVLMLVAAGCVHAASPPGPTPTAGLDAAPGPFRATLTTKAGDLGVVSAAGWMSTFTWNGTAATPITFPDNVFRFDPSSKRFSASHSASVGSHETFNLLLPPGMKSLTLQIGGQAVEVPTPATDHPFLDGRNIVDWLKVQRDQFPKRCAGCPSYAPAQQYFAKTLRGFGYSNVEIDPYNVDGVMATFANVVAFKYAKTDTAHPTWLGTGGHYDVVTGTKEGAFDNTAGTLAAVEMARVFANITTDHNMVFGLWGGEESGTQGSQFFVRTNPNVAAQMSTYVNLDVVGMSWPAPLPVTKDGSIPDCTTRPEQTATSNVYCPDPILVTAGPDGPVSTSMLAFAGRLQKNVAVGWPDAYFIYEPVLQGEQSGYARVNSQSDHESFMSVGVPVFFFFNGDTLKNPITIHNPKDTVENWTKYVLHNYPMDFEQELSPEERVQGETLMARSFEPYLWLTFYTFLFEDLGIYSPVTSAAPAPTIR